MQKTMKRKTKLKAEWIDRIIKITQDSGIDLDKEIYAWMHKVKKGVKEGITNVAVKKQWKTEDKQLKKSERKEVQRGSNDQRLYVHLSFLPIDEMIDRIGGPPCNKHNVKLSSLRLRTFKAHGTDCKKCGRKGTHWGIDHHRNVPDKNPHLNLWNREGEEPILMTCDHVLPLSRGGSDSLDNTQTLCGPCNWNKGSQTEEELKSKEEIT